MKFETFWYIITAALAGSHYLRFVHCTPSNRLELPSRRQRQLQLTPFDVTDNKNNTISNRHVKNIDYISNKSRCVSHSIHSKYRWHNRLRGGSSDPIPPSTSSGTGSNYWQRRPATPTNNNPLFSYSSSGAQSNFRKTQQQQQTQNQQTQQQQTQQQKQVEQEEVKDIVNEFLSRDDRTSFIARVYAILTGQLLVTSLSILLFSKNPFVTAWMTGRGRFVPMTSLLISTIAFSIMSASEDARRKAPRKWQLLTIFTLGESVAIGFIASLYSSKNVISAMMATAVGTISVTLYTLMNRNPKRDLSQWGATLSSVGTIFIVYSMIHLLSLFGILPENFLPYNESIFCFIGASLFSVYLAYHTRLIVSGKYTKYQMNRKDDAFGAMLLYNDIINIFLYILRLLGDRRD